jgi:hypothetical protein
MCILSGYNAIKLELNNKNNMRKYINYWKLNKTLLNHQWVMEEIRDEIQRCLEVNKKGKHHLSETVGIAKAVLRGKFIAMSACFKRIERSQINDLIIHLKFLEKQE